ILNTLISLKKLTHLFLKINPLYNYTNVQHKIRSILFSNQLLTLEYITLLMSANVFGLTNLNTSNPYLKYLTIERISFDQFLSLIQHLPNIKYLNAKLSRSGWPKTIELISVKLTHLILIIGTLNFELMQSLLKHCNQLIYLSLTFNGSGQLLDGQQFEKLFLFLPLLKIFYCDLIVLV
ncbi:unnamed protein product, partial [Didymodactylos carnosus]